MNTLELLNGFSSLNDSAVDHAFNRATTLSLDVANFMESDTITENDPHFAELEDIFNRVNEGLMDIIASLQSYTHL